MSCTINNVISGAIFDCDGTLLDSIDAWRTVEERLADSVGITMTLQDKKEIEGSTLEESAAILHDRYGVGRDAANVVEIIFDTMREFYTNEVIAKPFAQNYLRDLKEQGIKIALASATPVALLEIATKRCGMFDLFDCMFSPSEIGLPKRDPNFYLEVCKRLGSDKDNTWVFEDAGYAVASSKNAGFRVCGVFDSDYTGRYDDLKNTADVVIRSFDDLLTGKIVLS